MDVERELQNLLDRYKLENDIKSIFYKDKGLFDNSSIWLILILLMGLGGFGTVPPMPTSITNFYSNDKEQEVKE